MIEKNLFEIKKYYKQFLKYDISFSLLIVIR